MNNSVLPAITRPDRIRLHTAREPMQMRDTHVLNAYRSSDVRAAVARVLPMHGHLNSVRGLVRSITLAAAHRPQTSELLV